MTIANASRAVSDAARLDAALTRARARTLALNTDLTGAQLLGPRLAIVNPPLWEVGHVGWFQARWCLRHRGDAALAPSLLANADALYDSSAVPHDTRWDLPLPPLDDTLRYLARVREAVAEKLAREATPELVYFAELAAAHEEMHCEAFTYTRQTLGYAEPAIDAEREEAVHGGALPGDVEIAGGELMLGATRDGRFVFDNEKWAHAVEVDAFSMARGAVTNEQFAAFVADGGYTRRELWCEAGWAWRTASGAVHPVYWQQQDGAWFERRYDRMETVAPHRPVMHVSWYEAQAYCRWAKRRLPSEAEWEYAAAVDRAGGKRAYPWGSAAPDATHANFFGVCGRSADVGAFARGESAFGCRQMMGNVWEWTESTFVPYPGFVHDPYRDYSVPWFGTHKVLRGGSFASPARLLRNTWRNFYTPDRYDVFAGFRTCRAD